MIIDVIIPTYHPTGRLTESLRRLAEQSLPVRRALLLDTCDPDGSSPLERLLREAAIGTEIGGMKICTRKIPADQFDHGGTRALGADLCADADYLVFMTQDALPAGQDLIEELAKGFAMAPDIAASYARQLPDENARPDERISRELNYPDQSCVKTAADLKSLGVKTYFCSNVCAMYDTAIYRRLGGFVNHTVFNEDMIYAGHAVKAGYGICYRAQAKVYHSHNYTARQQFRRNFDLGVSQAEHPEVFAGISSEGEGRKFVSRVISLLRQLGESSAIPGFVIRCGFRLIGYRLGQNYRRVPAALIRKWTMSPAYWARQKQ